MLRLVLLLLFSRCTPEITEPIDPSAPDTCTAPACYPDLKPPAPL